MKTRSVIGNLPEEGAESRFGEAKRLRESEPECCGSSMYL
jgi:hypothetical protein